MANWTFLTNHARVLLCIAHDPGVRLRDIAASLGITERSTYGIVTDLAEAGDIVKQKTGRRNRYQIQAHLPLPEPTSQERTVGEVLGAERAQGASLCWCTPSSSTGCTPSSSADRWCRPRCRGPSGALRYLARPVQYRPPQ